jgi:hypothetical protein
MTENYVDSEDEADVTKDFLEDNYYDKRETYDRQEIETLVNHPTDLFDPQFHTVYVWDETAGAPQPNIYVGDRDQGTWYTRITPLGVSTTGDVNSDQGNITTMKTHHATVSEVLMVGVSDDEDSQYTRVVPQEGISMRGPDTQMFEMRNPEGEITAQLGDGHFSLAEGGQEGFSASGDGQVRADTLVAVGSTVLDPYGCHGHGALAEFTLADSADAEYFIASTEGLSIQGNGRTLKMLDSAGSTNISIGTSGGIRASSSVMVGSNGDYAVQASTGGLAIEGTGRSLEMRNDAGGTVAQLDGRGILMTAGKVEVLAGAGIV